MKKRIIPKWLAVALAFIITGLILLAVLIATVDWDSVDVGIAKYKTNEHEVTEAFQSVTLNTSTADIVFCASNDGCKVVCYEEENCKHTVEVRNGTLFVSVVDERKPVFRIFNMSFSSPKITIYLPSGEYDELQINASTSDVNVPDDFTFATVEIALSTGDVQFEANAGLITIATTTGKIELKNITAQDVSLSVSTGNVTMKNVSCKNLTSTGSTGKVLLEGVSASQNIQINRTTGNVTLNDTNGNDISVGATTGKVSLKNTTALQKIQIDTSTGDVNFDLVECDKFFVTTTTGDVSGRFLSEKQFTVHTTTGKVNVPSNTTTGGECNVTTTTGDVTISIKQY